MMADWLAILMCIIIAFIGGFICIYTVGYMKGYHKHHTEVKDRQPFFLLHAVSVSGGHVRTGAVPEPDLDVLSSGRSPV